MPTKPLHITRPSKALTDKYYKTNQDGITAPALNESIDSQGSSSSSGSQGSWTSLKSFFSSLTGGSQNSNKVPLLSSESDDESPPRPSPSFSNDASIKRVNSPDSNKSMHYSPPASPESTGKVTDANFHSLDGPRVHHVPLKSEGKDPLERDSLVSLSGSSSDDRHASLSSFELSDDEGGLFAPVDSAVGSKSKEKTGWLPFCSC